MDFIKYNLEEIILTMVILLVAYVLFYILKSKKRRRKIGFYIQFIAYKIGIRKRMSSKYVGMIHVEECYEPLVEIPNHNKIIFNRETVESPVLLRKNVAERLCKVANKLPDDIYIKIYSAYRSRIKLYNIWKEEVEKMEKENPSLHRAELLSTVKFKAVNPNTNLGGHDTGAAIDLSLCDRNGVDLDFGIKYHQSNNASKYDNALTKEQKDNLKYLSRIMKSQGFVQYPSQWWHYSYGDRYWAAYKGRRFGAIYGSAEKDFENTGYVAVVKTLLSASTRNK